MFKMLIKNCINRFRVLFSTIVFAKSIFAEHETSLPNILHVTIFGLKKLKHKSNLSIFSPDRNY